MVRAELKRPVGNPVSLKDLPRGADPDFTLPARILSPRQQRAHATELFLFACCLQLAAMAVTYMVLGAPGNALLFVAVLCLIAPWVFRPTTWKPRYKTMVIVAAAYALVIANLRLPVEFLGLCAVLGLICQGILFRHLYVGLALGTGLTRFNPPPNLKAVSLIVAFVDAAVQWLSYGIGGTPLPGQFRSPAGGYAFRLAFSVFVLVLVGLALNGSTIQLWITTLEPVGGMEMIVVPMILFPISFLLPLPLMVLSCFVISAGILGKCGAYRLAELDPETLAHSFHPMLDTVRRSQDKHEAASIPIGQLAYDGSVLWLRKSAFMEHLWLSGSTGAGKTAMTLRLAESAHYCHHVSILALDLKAASFELLHSLEAAAERVGQERNKPVPIWRFTNRPGHASHLFSLFHQPFWKNLMPEQKADVLLDAMAIAFERVYGASWFADAAHHILCLVLRKYPEITSFLHLRDKLEYELKHPRQNNIPPSALQDGVHALLIISRLAELEHMNDYGQHSKAVTDNAIYLDRLYREPCIVYASLATLHGPITAPEIGRILLSALSKTGLAMAPSERKVGVVCIVDEFASMIAGNLELTLQQARSTNTSLWLANQSVGDLVKSSFDLTSCLETNTAAQLFFASIDQKGLEQIERLSGKTTELMISESFGEGPNGSTYSKTYSEQIVPRLTVNEIAEAASHEDQFICRMRKNEGYACYNGLPFVATTGGYHITRQEYERRKNQRWPEKTPDTIVVGRQPQVKAHESAYPGRSRPIVETGAIGQNSLHKRTRPRP